MPKGNYINTQTSIARSFEREVNNLKQENEKLRAALSEILETKYRAGESRLYVEKLLQIAKEALAK